MKLVSVISAKKNVEITEINNWGIYFKYFNISLRAFLLIGCPGESCEYLFFENTSTAKTVGFRIGSFEEARFMEYIKDKYLPLAIEQLVQLDED